MVHWQPSIQGLVKINTDVGIRNGVCSCGIVVRDSQSNVLEVESKKECINIPKVAEFFAVY